MPESGSQELLATSREAVERYRKEQATLRTDSEGRCPAPGDIYVVDAAKDFGLEWAVLAQDPATPARFLVVPADGHVLTGTADIELDPGPTTGALKLRCRFGEWTDQSLLRPDRRVGVLRRTELAQARQRWLDVGDGWEAGDELAAEVDQDPGYRDWVDEVVEPARAALTAATARHRERVAAGGLPQRAQRTRRTVALQAAASIVLVLVGFLLWQMNDRVRDLARASHSAEQRHRVELHQAERLYRAELHQAQAEVDLLAADRNRLRSTQQDLEAVALERGTVVGRLREKVAELQSARQETEEGHRARLRQVEAARASLETERKRLLLRQRDLQAAAADSRETILDLRGQVSRLGEELDELKLGSPPRSPYTVALDGNAVQLEGLVSLAEPRAARIELNPGRQGYFDVVMFSTRTSASQLLRFDVWDKSTNRRVWRDEDLEVGRLGEVRAALPTRVLRDGDYSLQLFALEEGSLRKILKYSLRVELRPDGSEHSD